MILGHNQGIPFSIFRMIWQEKCSQNVKEIVAWVKTAPSFSMLTQSAKVNQSPLIRYDSYHCILDSNSAEQMANNVFT